MRAQLPASVCIAACLLLVAPASADPIVTISRVAGPDSAVKPLGNRPSLHDGVVAFYGYTGAIYAADPVVATALIDGSGLGIIAARGNPRPDRPEMVFESFGNPGIHGGRVIFYGDEIGGFPSTYTAPVGGAYALFDDAGIANPFVGPNGVTSPASPNGVSFRNTDGALFFLGQYQNPAPCGLGFFDLINVPGLRQVPQGGEYFVWPAYAGTQSANGNLVVAVHTATGTLRCVASAHDTIPDFGGPFEAFLKADTDGINSVFIGTDPTPGFGRHEGVYIRDVMGAGPIRRVADKGMPAPGGGSLTGFSNATVDGDLVIFECFAAGGGNARYGFFGCFLDDGVPGEIFEILTNAQPLDGRPIADLTMSPGGRDGYRFAFDVRHAANSASLYVATVQRASSGCPADFAEPFGTLNFFDVAAYIDAFNAQDPAADLADPSGVLNFFDVAAFIDAYDAGCP